MKRPPSRNRSLLSRACLTALSALLPLGPLCADDSAKVAKPTTTSKGAVDVVGGKTPKDRIEWTVWFGGATNLGVPSVEDRWSVEATGFGARIAVTASALYEPATALGANGGAQMWLPFGLGVFAELQRQTQDQSSRIGVDATLTFPLYPLSDSSVTEGRLDTERFERNDSRLHFGLGYRIQAGRDSYFEVSGGASRISIKQELARGLISDDSGCAGTRCTVELSLEKRESHKGSTWGLNGGFGFTKFVGEVVGLGVHFRYSRGGKLEMEGLDAVDATGREYRNKVTVKSGAFSAGANLRLRFF